MAADGAIDCPQRVRMPRDAAGGRRRRSAVRARVRSGRPAERSAGPRRSGGRRNRRARAPAASSAPSSTTSSSRRSPARAGRRGALRWSAPASPVDADAERLRRVAATCGYVARRRFGRSRLVGWCGAVSTDCAPHSMPPTACRRPSSMAASTSTASDALAVFPSHVEIVAPGARRCRAPRRGSPRTRLGECANFARALCQRAWQRSHAA